MPGIVGIVSQAPAAQGERLVREMASSLMHEPFYASSFHTAPALHVYGGSVAFAESANSEVFTGPSGATALLFSGECLPDSPEQLVRRYEDEGDAVFAQLNGLFSGLLVDHRQRRAVLFNDRFGFDRIYVAETNDAVYFASEAKALLRVLPDTRSFDAEGLAEFLAVGCTVGERSLFRGIRLLPPASCWTFDERGCTKARYFHPREWEQQGALDEGQFEAEFDRTCAAAVPKYFAGDGVGIALTGGIDSRIVLACRPRTKTAVPCYTYDGPAETTLDSEISRELAQACEYPHNVLRLGRDFFEDFAEHAERTVYLTDGYFGPTGAHEIYLSRAARALAPVRVTGVFGGEVFRGVSTFKPLGLDERVFAAGMHAAVTARASDLAHEEDHPVTAAAFTKLPPLLHGSLASCRSQLTFRTPYLDTDVVKLAFRVPAELRGASSPAVRMLARKDPRLAQIGTDMGELGSAKGVSHLLGRGFAKATFKLDYLRNDGMPHWLTPAESMIDSLNKRVRLFGHHKYLRYRKWFRAELAEYVRDSLASRSLVESGLWNRAFVSSIGDAHVAGRRNHVQEINALLTIDTVQRLLFTAAPRSAERSVDLRTPAAAA